MRALFDRFRGASRICPSPHPFTCLFAILARTVCKTNGPVGLAVPWILSARVETDRIAVAAHHAFIRSSLDTGPGKHWPLHSIVHPVLMQQRIWPYDLCIVSLAASGAMAEMQWQYQCYRIGQRLRHASDAVARKTQSIRHLQLRHVVERP